MADKRPLNNAKTANPAIVRAQARLMTTKRIMGKSVAQIAAEFEMSHDTVQRRLAWAKRHGMVEDALDTVLDHLVPEAVKTYLAAIQSGDIDAARDVMFGTGVLQKAPKTGLAPTQSVEMTIETYRNNRKLSVTTNLPSVEASPSACLPEHPGVPEIVESEPYLFDLQGRTAGMGEDDD